MISPLAIGAFRKRIGPRVWRLFALSVLMGLFWFACETAFVYVLQAFMVSLGLIDREKTALINVPFFVENALLVLIAFSILRAAVTFFKGYLVSNTFNRFVVEQRLRLFTTGLHGAHRISMRELLALFGDTTNNAGAFVNYLTLFLLALFSAGLFFIFGLYLAPYEMVIGVFLLFLFSLPFRRMGRAISAAGVATNREWEQIYANLLSGLKNHFLLRIYRRTGVETAEGSRRLEAYFGHTRTQSRTFGFTSVYPLMVGMVVIVALTAIAQKATGTAPMTLVSFFYIFIRFAQAASDSNSNLSMVRFHAASFRRLMEFHESQPSTESDSPTPRGFFDRVHSIAVENLGFSFDERPLFKEISFTLAEGRSLAIVGESGSGKSTLLSLLFGLLKPVTGRVVLNGRDLADTGTAFYEQVGYVGSEPFIIEGSVRENLLFGHAGPVEITDDDCWRALSVASLANEIRVLNGGLDHVLRDAYRLSTGQRQRLSIARAALRNPSLFIFDEGTANLDSLTEARVLKQLRESFPLSLLIFVTHRRELAAQADHILELGPAR